MLESCIASAFQNFALTMFVVATFFIVLHRFIRKGIPESEIIYRWMALFALGLTGIFTFVMHVFYPALTAMSIGWVASPFQYEVGIADLAFGVLGILSFNASYGFRLATVIGATIWLWGDAIGHIYQILRFQNFAPGNAGSWFWMDILIPIVLLLCIRRLKTSR